MMAQHYAGYGLCFGYPDHWELSEECAEEQVSITVSSPGTAFWSVTVLRNGPDPHDVVRAAVQAFEDEYDPLDVNETSDHSDFEPWPGAEVSFVCLDLTSTAVLKACRWGRLTLLVLYQSHDADFEQAQPLMEQISASLRLESDSPRDP